MPEASHIRRTGRRPGSLAPLLGLVLLVAVAGRVEAQALRGSAASLDRQNAQARAHDFSLLRTASQVAQFVESGYLVRIRPDQNFELHAVSYPYARPAVRVFIERLAAQYRSACGEKLVVTSLTRPTSEQPSNASDRSVHPTGMAIDLRRSGTARCRSWLESTLLKLEGDGVLEATLEMRPVHYHLALFPEPYMAYLETMGAPVPQVAAASQTEVEVPAPARSGGVHRVARGENLTAIAARFGVSVAELRAENNLRTDKIMAGQQLRIPGAEPAGGRVLASADAPSPEVAPSALLPQTSPRTHTIAGGENLTAIADRYGVTVTALRVENNLRSDKILAGQRLRIPGSGSAGGTTGESIGSVQASLPPEANTTRTHTIARGESLWEIARSYGVTESVLRAVNGISGSSIYAGQKLRIPGEGEDVEVVRYTVRNGDSLWVIASRLGTTVEEIRASNGMDTTRIYAGQVLTVPLSR